MENGNRPKKDRDYLRFLAGQIISLLGSDIVGFVLGIYLARTYQNAFYFAISMILQFVPRVIISPIAGVWADKRDRKKIVISSDMIQAIITTSLVVLFNLNALFSWSFWVAGEIYILFGFILLRSIFQAVQGPSVSSILPTIVPHEKLSRLNGVLQFAQGATGLIAPIVAGFLMNFWKVYNLLWIDAITFLIALLFVLTVKIPLRAKPLEEIATHTVETRLRKFFKDFAEGPSVTKEIKGLSALLVVLIFTNFFVSPINTLSDILILVIHGGSNNEYVIVSISFAAGLIVGSFIASVVKTWKNMIATLFIGLIGLYSGLFVVGVTPIGVTGSIFGIRGSFWIIAAGGFITTFGLPLSSTIAVTMIQLTVPLEKMGRFSGFMNALISLITPFSYLLSGYLGTIIYIPFVIMGASIIAIIIMNCMWIFSPIGKLEPLIKEKLMIARKKSISPDPTISPEALGRRPEI